MRVGLAAAGLQISLDVGVREALRQVKCLDVGNRRAAGSKAIERGLDLALHLGNVGGVGRLAPLLHGGDNALVLTQVVHAAGFAEAIVSRLRGRFLRGDNLLVGLGGRATVAVIILVLNAQRATVRLDDALMLAGGLGALGKACRVARLVGPDRCLGV